MNEYKGKWMDIRDYEWISGKMNDKGNWMDIRDYEWI